jgi:beta-galactosidase/beta-glucuronidase
LNGRWEFALDADANWQVPSDVVWRAHIEVPFAPETTASGINHTRFFKACWYRTHVAVPDMPAGDRLLLHFQAVDHDATVWIDGMRARRHEGGYTPFSVDLTPYLRRPAQLEIVVRAFDDPQDLAKPRGKQDWLEDPHLIWYPRTTGIWQSVWLERVPATSIAQLRWTADLARWEIELVARFDGVTCSDARLSVVLHIGDRVIAADDYGPFDGDVCRRIAFPDPGIDDYRNELLWSPQSPTLIDADIKLKSAAGRVIDHVKSYTALRAVGVQGHTIVLNGRPERLCMVLDQGYWPTSGLTAPSDAALRADVELVKAMGFNGVRKHQKIESPRYLYWADRLGLLVWEEMPSPYRFTTRSIELLTREWMQVIERDYSHPCIIAWVPFNESWGVPNLPEVPSERHFVQAIYHLTKTLDPTRPVIGNDGWESVDTDIIGIHDYDEDLDRLSQRYASIAELRPRFFSRERPGGRLLKLDETSETPPIMLTEFGGIALPGIGETGWGYTRARDEWELGRRYNELLDVVRSIELFSGFCYTQFADTYQERNGLLTADRVPKFALELIAQATRGPLSQRQREIESEWVERAERFRRRWNVSGPDDG